MKPDALLPFAIAAIMGFLVLGLRGGEKEVDFSKIRGRIQFVDNSGDYKVKAVESFPDYRIQWVDSFPDFTIQYVNSLPGASN